jgi:ABC-type multidrug transport system ATPase subunit
MGVEVRELTKIYDKSVKGLDSVSLQVETGVLGLLGPNGAGKTTLMRILATLLDPTSGAARVDGYDVRRQRRDVRRILGYLPQTFGLYPQMTCVEFLDYVGLLYGMGAKERRSALDRTIEQVHLEEFASRRIRALSGGMRQRLGIAQAVLTEPRLLIVDEPTTGLDPEERIRIRNLIGELARNRVVILSTHIVGDVSATATSLALIRKGNVLFHGSPAELLRQAQGRVWQVRLDEAEMPRLKQSYPVTSVSHTPDGMEARILADSPDGVTGVSSIEPVPPGLEDAYLWKMGSGEGNPGA